MLFNQSGPVGGDGPVGVQSWGIGGYAEDQYLTPIRSTSGAAWDLEGRPMLLDNTGALRKLSDHEWEEIAWSPSISSQDASVGTDGYLYGWRWRGGTASRASSRVDLSTMEADPISANPPIGNQAFATTAGRLVFFMSNGTMRSAPVGTWVTGNGDLLPTDEHGSSDGIDSLDTAAEVAFRDIADLNAPI
jgi:hypothetical protein